jgi:hypothetical protein
MGGGRGSVETSEFFWYVSPALWGAKAIAMTALTQKDTPNYGNAPGLEFRVSYGWESRDQEGRLFLVIPIL